MTPKLLVVTVFEIQAALELARVVNPAILVMVVANDVGKSVVDSLPAELVIVTTLLADEKVGAAVVVVNVAPTELVEIIVTALFDAGTVDITLPGLVPPDGRIELGKVLIVDVCVPTGVVLVEVRTGFVPPDGRIELGKIFVVDVCVPPGVVLVEVRTGFVPEDTGKIPERECVGIDE